MNYFKTNDVEVGFNFRSRTPDGCLSGLRYLPGLDAARAHTNPLRRAIHKSLHRLQIHVPPAPRHIVRVRNVISELRPFAANVAYLCHRPTPRFVGISRRLCRSRRFLRRPVLRAREPLARTRARPCRLAEFSVYREPASQPRRPLLQRHRLRRLPRLRMSANVPPFADHFQAPQHNEIVPAPPQAREPDPIPLRANSLSSIESGLICQGCARFKMSGCARSIPVEVPAEPCPRNCATAPYLSHRHFLQTPLNTCDRCRNCSTWNNCDFSQGPKDATKVCPFTPFV